MPKRKNTDYFFLLCELTDECIASAEKLKNAICGRNFNFPSNESINDTDKIRFIITECLRKDFFTPVDRDDILKLTQLTYKLNSMLSDSAILMESNTVNPSDSTKKIADCIIDEAKAVKLIFEGFRIFPKMKNTDKLLSAVRNTAEKEKIIYRNIIGGFSGSPVKYDIINGIHRCSELCLDIADYSEITIVKNS